MDGYIHGYRDTPSLFYVGSEFMFGFNYCFHLLFRRQVNIRNTSKTKVFVESGTKLKRKRHFSYYVVKLSLCDSVLFLGWTWRPD